MARVVQKLLERKRREMFDVDVEEVGSWYADDVGHEYMSKSTLVQQC
jgi:hypothetical protein